MANRTLTTDDVQDICAAMRNLRGAAAKQTALELATFHNVSYSRICDVTKSVRPARKQRADKGKRKADLFADDGLRLVAELAVNHNLNTELAVEMAKLNGYEINLSDGTINRYKREFGIGRNQMRSLRQPYQSFQAEFPLQIFQFDISGVKERWVDVKTRGILKVPLSEVSDNHPNKRADRVRLWKMNGCDDDSRFRVCEYLAVAKPNSTHYINYLRRLVVNIGLPFSIYTDNDSILTSKRIQRGADIINKMFAESGGFQLIQHAPGNPQATGKIERGHQIVEQYERLIGVKIEYGDVPTVDSLNQFALWACDRYNKRSHRTTGEQPRLRIRNTNYPRRVITIEEFDAAFLSQELTLPLNGDVTVTINKIKYALPREDKYPFVSLAAYKNVKLTVIFMDDADFLIVITPNGDEFPVPRVEAKIQIGMGEKMPESASALNLKALKVSGKERKAQLKAENQKLLVQGFDTEIAEDSIRIFPQRTEIGDSAVLDELTHNIRQTKNDSRRFDYYAALDSLQEREIFAAPPAKADAAWLKSLFAETETITEADLETALANRQPSQFTTQPQTKTAQVRHLRAA